MTVRWAGFAAPFRWLVSAVDVGRHQPGVVIAAALVLAAAQTVPGLFSQLLTATGLPPGVSMGVSQAFGMLVSLLVFPVLLGGFYRILDGADRGTPVRFGLLGEGFGDGSMRRLVVTQLLVILSFLLVLAVMIAVIFASIGADGFQALAAWFQQVAAMQAEQAAGTASIAPPAPPGGMGMMAAVFLAFMPLFILLGFGGSVAIAEAALRGSGARDAFSLGMRAAFTNAASLLVMVLVLMLPVTLLMALVAFVVTAIAGVLGLVSPALAGIVAVLLFLPLTALFLAWLYAFSLQAWRSICGGDAGMPPAQSSLGFEA